MVIAPGGLPPDEPAQEAGDLPRGMVARLLRPRGPFRLSKKSKRRWSSTRAWRAALEVESGVTEDSGGRRLRPTGAAPARLVGAAALELAIGAACAVLLLRGRNQPQQFTAYSGR